MSSDKRADKDKMHVIEYHYNQWKIKIEQCNILIFVFICFCYAAFYLDKLKV